MGKIKKIEQLTHNPFVNLYHLDVENRVGNPGKYYVASRAKEREGLEICTKEQKPDGVIIYSLYGEKRDRVVLIRQYRYAIDGYIYEFPAGLLSRERIITRLQCGKCGRKRGLRFIRFWLTQSMKNRIILR